MTCFSPALQAVSQALREAQSAALQPEHGKADSAGGDNRLRMVAAQLARLFATLAVRRRMLPDDPEAPLQAGNGERLMAAAVMTRAELRLAQQAFPQGASRPGISAAREPPVAAEGLATGSAAVLAAAQDARTLLGRRAAAALTGLLIDEPLAVGPGPDARVETPDALWLTLHGAVTQLQLQGASCCFPYTHGLQRFTARCRHRADGDGASHRFIVTEMLGSAQDYRRQGLIQGSPELRPLTRRRCRRLLVTRAAGQAGCPEARDRGAAPSRASGDR